MRATETLKNEHRVIEQALRALEGMALEAVKQHRLVREDAALAIDFIRSFADRFHHAKEEDLLFVEMEAAGFSRQAGPTSGMLQDHVMVRRCVGRMEASLDKVAAGDAAALEGFASAAREFVDLLRGHIHKEDDILYPMADEALGEGVQLELGSSFEEADKLQGGAATRDRYVEVARRLLERYGSATTG